MIDHVYSLDTSQFGMYSPKESQVNNNEMISNYLSTDTSYYPTVLPNALSKVYLETRNLLLTSRSDPSK
ncbi:hypothetical protein RclHR1_16010005 [Rhizophagus clarus]|uniref:Uncharacterized protein n=1 Tax=Rhizophagus clarus TaxID=94130 RepID=A0A2Z6QVT7_9GLOM|nr:hypothetical protein RclHR1_16010005 [Rhizophagus clarus]GES89250.1 hypothetical protein RCL_e3793_RclHR1_16010005 [Rhizophagus clarus]